MMSSAKVYIIIYVKIIHLVIFLTSWTKFFCTFGLTNNWSFIHVMNNFCRDIGQTYNSNTTLTHCQNDPRKPKVVSYPGDLSYADTYPLLDNVRWDTWSRFVEKSAFYQSWMWCVCRESWSWLASTICKYLIIISLSRKSTTDNISMITCYFNNCEKNYDSLWKPSEAYEFGIVGKLIM